MLRSKPKIAIPLLCFCFWIIIFSVFLNFFFNLVSTTHTQKGEGEGCANIPIQNQYQLVKNGYIWKGAENITDAVLRQPCPDSEISSDIYYANSYIGGVRETEPGTLILNCKKEVIYTFSNVTLYDSSEEIVGTMDWEEDNLLILTNPRSELVAQWNFDSNFLTLEVHLTSLSPPSEVEENRVLLFAIASKYIFESHNECTTKYWMSLQIIIISGVLSIVSIVSMGIILCKIKQQLPNRYSHKNFRLTNF